MNEMVPLKVRGGKTLPAEGIDRILIRGTNWIGDVVMTRKDENLAGIKLLLLQPLTPQREPAGRPLVAVCRKAMAARPEDRYPTATALADRYSIGATRSFIQADYAQIAAAASGTWVRVPSTTQWALSATKPEVTVQT